MKEFGKEGKWGIGNWGEGEEKNEIETLSEWSVRSKYAKKHDMGNRMIEGMRVGQEEKGQQQSLAIQGERLETETECGVQVSEPRLWWSSQEDSLVSSRASE